jgi:hypothetical protein
VAAWCGGKTMESKPCEKDEMPDLLNFMMPVGGFNDC